jgi:probable blue pigment (indigoidine) exporter
VLGGALGVLGVAVMLLGGGDGARIDPLGVLASVAAMTLSSIGYVLATRWRDDVPVLPSTAWQLVAGALVLLPFAVAVEGAPPALDGTALLGFGYVSVVATALAYLAWYTALRRLGPATVGLVGLLNPVTGVLLGTVVAAEPLSARQGLGIAVVLGAMALGATGRGATGRGATGQGATGRGATGQGATGTGPDAIGPDAIGSDAIGADAALPVSPPVPPSPGPARR